MKAYQLRKPGPASSAPLEPIELETPHPPSGNVLLRVLTCGVCRTDLHIIEGDLELPLLPVIPGHQIVGMIEKVGKGVPDDRVGTRVGVPWIGSTCGECGYCGTGRENLCERARFTGFHCNGGFAEYAVVPAVSSYRLPERFSDEQAAPLLCAGVIGYRALRLSGAESGMTVALYGFGASAHITLQVLKHIGCDVQVFTRGRTYAQLAESLGASWTGSLSTSPPRRSDAAIVFAPAGEVVHVALENLNKGGTVSLAGIHMTPIPEMPYELIYGERVLRSAANSTRQDVREMLDLAGKIPVRTETEVFPLDAVNEVLLKLKRSELKASGVLRIG